MLFSFILVEPAVAENVGSSARALKTMGFDRLVIVNSKVHLEPRASWVAHGSSEILDNIREYKTLDEAVKDAGLVIGTTAKRRRTHSDYYPCTEIPRLIQSKSGMLEHVAIVFGREESGLTNDEMRCCHIFSGVPMQTVHPTLNLAQTVMIYAWELMRFNLTHESGTSPGTNSTFSAGGTTVTGESPSGTSQPSRFQYAKGPSGGKIERLRSMVKRLLGTIGYNSQSPVYLRIMERFEALGDKDTGLLLSICTRLDEMLPADGAGRVDNEAGDPEN
jgi:tRNA/rRNA methyltransferase